MNLTFNRTTITVGAFMLFGGYLLWTEHSAHIWPYLPWLIFLACPLMHFFMHGGHGHDGHGKHDERQDDTRIPRDVSDAPPPESTRVPQTGGRHE